MQTICRLYADYMQTIWRKKKRMAFKALYRGGYMDNYFSKIIVFSSSNRLYLRCLTVLEVFLWSTALVSFGVFTFSVLLVLVCSLPFEYCKWGGKYDECVEWAKKNNKSGILFTPLSHCCVSCPCWASLTEFWPNYICVASCCLLNQSTLNLSNKYITRLYIIIS